MLFKKMWLEYVGPKYPGGVGEDFEHTKYGWGPENNWRCEVPTILAGMMIQERGTDMFMPCMPADYETLVEDNKRLIKENQELAIENQKLSAAIEIELDIAPLPETRTRKYKKRDK